MTSIECLNEITELETYQVPIKIRFINEYYESGYEDTDSVREVKDGTQGKPTL